MKPFDYLNAINTSKKNLMEDSANDQLAEKSYEPYLTNRGLSYFPDTIFYANEMNQYHTLDKKPQFLFLLNSIRMRKRFSKWFKPSEQEDVLFISEIFDYNKSKSREAYKILTKNQINDLRVKTEKGG